jgi:hypothetical protein
MSLEDTAPRAESKPKYHPPCLEFFRVPKCIFDAFLVANDLGDQAIFDDFMDGLEERWRLELLAITREAVDVVMSRRAGSLMCAMRR